MSVERSKVASMVRWLRLILSVFALAGLLAAGTCGPVAANTHHHCPNMMMHQHQSGGGDRGTMPECCATAACFVVQPAASSQDAVILLRALAQAFLLPLDDARISSLPVSPDLRPPIA
jgi:hypothetical protein